MVPQPRAGSFSPNPAQNLQTGAANHSPYSLQPGISSAAASPSTSSPTTTNPLTKIVVAQIYLLLSTIKEDRDHTKWEVQADQLRKLIDDHGMEVFSKYFTRLVAANAPLIFPALNRPAIKSGNYHLLVGEMNKILQDVDQASKIAESIEVGTEDIFRDFDLAVFMDHFELDAVEKTTLAVAFKTGYRTGLKTKADTILTSNFPSFVDILSQPSNSEHYADLSSSFISFILDRLVQYHPPTFNSVAKAELAHRVPQRYTALGEAPPPEVLAAIDLVRVLSDKPPSSLALHILRTGSDFTRDVDSCISYLQARFRTNPPSEEQVSIALTYCTVSRTPKREPSILVEALRVLLPASFRWQEVISYFDQRSSRLSSRQFLKLYKSLLPITRDESQSLDLQLLWGGNWENPEAQLSFICAYAALRPDELDPTEIPRIELSITLDSYAESSVAVQKRAAVAARHPLVSVAALSAIFHVALQSVHASQSVEAKRLFQDVVVPNLDIFVVSAFGVPKPWPNMAVETINSLFENFLYKQSPEYEFVLESLWKKDKDWVTQRLVDAHAIKPVDLTVVFEHAMRHKWLDELVYLPTGFGLDLAALAHAEGCLDLSQWARNHSERNNDIANALLQFLAIKARLEIQHQRIPEGQDPVKSSTTLQIRTVAALLQILEECLPRAPVPDLIVIQRECITAYPRLINYGEGYDEVIDANGNDGNALPGAANSKMLEHYKKMYGDEMQVRSVVDVLQRYKHSRDPLDQDVFACMIHGLFDEYTHYVTYPLEALATTAVLFGGIISHKLVSDLPLKIGLGMILEAVRDHASSNAMFKFGLQALMQLFPRLAEWPGFCRQLLQIPGLQNTDVWHKSREVIQDLEEEISRSRGPSTDPVQNGPSSSFEAAANGESEEFTPVERYFPPFASLSVEPPWPEIDFEEPNMDAQGKVQFFLNNLTDVTLPTMCRELQDILGLRHLQWFASHLVEERAKMQPNYHHVYLDLVKLFEDRVLASEVLRETYVSVARMLNSDTTMQSSSERMHLKNLGAWLGLLTLAHDKPIKHRNIAIKQLLLEALDTKRLIVVIPFVCKVLIQGAQSAVFRPPNPWLMDMIHLLIELYHHAELKLNLKFEIEVLCKGLNLDHKSIEPSGELLNRAVSEDVADLVVGDDTPDAFESLHLNVIGGGSGSVSSNQIPVTIPDLGPLITVPPTNEMVITTGRLHELVRTALNRALQDIIQPVVDRSVTIAAISTAQIIRKDFATEMDEIRVRTCANKMVKATAGSLALVTSKEPLRANLTNYLRNLSSELSQALPEGTIIMCVNSNIELACSVIEKQAEERAVPEIEDILEPDLEARRRHRLTRPNDPFVDPGLSRWSWTIPNPYKLSPSLEGLNSEQMAIYEDFASKPRTTSTNVPSHAPSTSDTTRSLANEVLQEQFGSLSNMPASDETTSNSHLGAASIQSYTATSHSTSLPNGRNTSFQDMRALADRVQKLLVELQRVAIDAPEEHFVGLPRPHAVLDVVDALVQLIIKTSQTSEEFAIYAAEQICQLIFNQVEDNLALESLVHVLETLRRIGGPALNTRVDMIFHQQPGDSLLSLPLLTALARTDLLDWRVIDVIMSDALQQRKEGSLEFLENLLDLTLLNSRPLFHYMDFIQTLEAAWLWIQEDGGRTGATGQRLKSKLIGTDFGLIRHRDNWALRQESMEYVFEEWVHLYNNSLAPEKLSTAFIRQLQAKSVISCKDDLLVFIRVGIEVAVENFEQIMHPGVSVTEAYLPIDALSRFIGVFLTCAEETELGHDIVDTKLIDSILALATLILNHHHTVRGEHFSQRAFFRLFSGLAHEITSLIDGMTDGGGLDVMFTLAARLEALGPKMFPGFIYGWLGLIQHRCILPELLQSRVGWKPYAALLSQLLRYLGEHLKSTDVAPVAKDVYRGTVKLLLVLQHDFPDFLAAYSHVFCQCVPPHTAQLLGIILATVPNKNTKLTSSTLLEAKDNQKTDLRELPLLSDDSSQILDALGLSELLDVVLQSGPSEDAVAHITRAFTQRDGETCFGHVPIVANLNAIRAVMLFLGNCAIENSGLDLDVGSREVMMLMFIIRELPAEARYYCLSFVVDQLRYPNAHTNLFNLLVLEIFKGDREVDHEDMTDIRQQICRILLERLVGFWRLPQPWGLTLTVVELLKNEKYMFFELPFIKSTPEVADRFAAILQRAS